MGDIKNRSGNVTDNRPVVAFLYTLFRDEQVSIGRIEEVVQHIENNPKEAYEFSNGWLAKYSQDIIDRLEE